MLPPLIADEGEQYCSEGQMIAVNRFNDVEFDKKCILLT